MKLVEKIKALWTSLPLKWRKEMASVSQTFLATFSVFIATQISSGTIQWDRNALLALGIAAARASLKAAFNSLLAQSKKSEDESHSP